MMAVVSIRITRQEASDGRVEPSAPAHDRGHDGPQSIAGNAAILCPRGGEVQPIFQPLAGPARSGGRTCVPGASGLDGHLVARAEPDGLRPPVPLWRDARP